jgi:hypothetical protein
MSSMLPSISWCRHCTWYVSEKPSDSTFQLAGTVVVMARVHR